MKEKNDIERFYYHEVGDFAVDLFPYKIKNRDLFYDRDHPVNLHPDTLEYDSYWDDKIKNYIEGRWVYDEGTWVFMPNKLDFYINYTYIVDEERTTIQPRLRDNEWIISYYIMMCDGFYGFEGDDIFTCHPFVKKREDVINEVEGAAKLKTFEKNYLEENKHLKTPFGTFKKYVEPWVYLTETYLITHKRDKPLGKALWDRNRCEHAVIVGARGTCKSFAVFMMDFLHEWTFSGITSVEDYEAGLANRDMIFGMGSAHSTYIDKSVANIQRFYNQMPGAFKDEKCYGALYKDITGTWESGNTITHKVVRKDNTLEISGSKCNISVVTPQNKRIGAGDRFRRIYIEEVGFLPFIQEVHDANKDSLRVGEKYIGSAFYLGTGGSGDDIKEAKEMFENPKAYRVASMPNYFNKVLPNARCGLFLSAIYKAEDYKDPQGNTLIAEALENVIEERLTEKKSKDSVAFQRSLAWNPIYPKEMLNISSNSLFPVIELADYRQELMEFKVLSSMATVGRIKADKNRESGYAFEPDLNKTLTPIIEWGNEKAEQTNRGAWILYEDVIYPTPENLYYVLYDPVQVSGTGTSLNSILVYKHAHIGFDDSLQDTIVAEWIGRTDLITDAYKEVIKISKYFGAKIFCETNVNGFIEWVRDNKYMDKLLPEPYKTIQENQRSKYKGSRWKKGVRMNAQLNDKALLKLSDWLREKVSENPITGEIIYKYHHIRSPRILSELINYDHENKTQFDHVSSLFLLMILKTELDKNPIKIQMEDNPEDDRYAHILEKRKLQEIQNRRKKTSRLMQTV